MPDPNERITINSLTRTYGSLRRVAVAYARGRMTVVEELGLESALGSCSADTFVALHACAALALVDDRKDPATAWKP